MRNKYLYVALVVLCMFISLVRVTSAEEPWVCGSDVATEAIKASFRSVWGNNARQAWLNEAGCGIVLAAEWPVYAAPVAPSCGFWDKMKGTCAWENVDLSDTDQLARMSESVGKVTSQPAADRAAGSAKKVLNKAQEVYDKTTGTTCGFWDKMKAKNGCKFD